jgi:hypothetical protein
MFLLTITNLANCPNNFGVYKIFAYNNLNQPIPINRFGGIDKNGLLYIGQTYKQGLPIRIGNFLRVSGAHYKSNNHSGALKYKKNKKVQDVLGRGHKLFYSFEICLNPKNRENELLNSYAIEFGEYPPLNG